VSTPADGELEYDLSSFLEMLERVPDPRNSRGKVYKLSFILAAALVAKLAGASNFRQIHDQVMDMPQPLLAKLGADWCYFRLYCHACGWGGCGMAGGGGWARTGVI
jgi:DDE_Tnp_1-associated